MFPLHFVTIKLIEIHPSKFLIMPCYENTKKDVISLWINKQTFHYALEKAILIVVWQYHVFENLMMRRSWSEW